MEEESCEVFDIFSLARSVLCWVEIGCVAVSFSPAVVVMVIFRDD